MPLRSRPFAALALALCWPATGHAGDACPSQVAVERAVSELAAREPGGPVFDERARQSLELTDLGASFRVELAGRERQYADPERDCERRARLAAVFIALVLTGDDAQDAAPPAPSVPPSPSHTPPAPPVPPAPPPAAHDERRLAIDGAARIAFAPSDAGWVVLPGAELGAAFMPGELGVRVAVAAPFARGTLAVGPASARFARYPLTAALRWRLGLAPFVAAIDAGAETALVTLARDDGSHATTRVDVAARVGLSLSVAALRVSPVLSAFTELVPVRFPLALEPDGPITKTPSLWVGATAGVVFAF